MTGSQVWGDSWFRDTSEHMEMPGAWRGILTEYFTASLKLVADADELEVLEELLQACTPTLHSYQEDKHPQLLAPFNFRPKHASRFRAADRSGFWYGASTLEAAQSEVAYWRMMYIRDSVGLTKSEVVTDHSFFRIDVTGLGINLMREPWVQHREIWRHPTDYTATQALAAAAEAENIEWMQYESVRAPHAPLAVVFTPNALRGTTQEVNATLQEWTCKTNLDRVVFVNRSSGEMMAWTIDGD
ncbi:RES domain-containing protein [Comamonas sp. w2-DMI]|uniref:RES domain-containing protein n=1 Tax=Comamonas sp. w2-DMI TaxID=3126391 RepID=UPI0032E5202F